MKILIFGNAPWAPSGYGTQALQLGRTFRKHGHEVGFAAFWGLHGSPQGYDNFPVFCGSSEDEFARDLLPVWYKQFAADLCITLMDVFALDGNQLQGMNLAHWMPIDTDRLSVLDTGVLQLSPGRPVAISRHGEKVLADAGLKPLYAPHALDVHGTWQPLDDRDDVRKRTGLDGLFVIGINAANQDPERKGFGEQVDAFAKFAEGKDDVRLAIHSRARTRMGPDLNHLIASYGIGSKVILAPQELYAGGLITDAMMAAWHGSIDVLSNCAYGEGFGLPVLQSQATGIPVIVNDCSAMTELCGCGWRVPGQRKWNRGHGANWQIPYIHSIVAAYEDAYAKRGEEGMRAQARQFSLAYDADRVYEEHWAAILDELGPERHARAQRRVWSPVMFRDETDMLAMRLAETDGLIDRTVIVEAETTHRNVPKELTYRKAGKRLARHAAKISHVVAVLPGAEDPWVNEHAQRDAAWPVIDAEAADSDLVLITDVDEIPSRPFLERLRKDGLPGDVAAVRMKVYIHHARWRVPDEMVPPQCVVATVGYIRRHGGSLAAVRDARAQYDVIKDGGWHFSWFGGPEAAKVKLETATCHTELLTNGEGDLIADGTRYYTTENGGGLPVVPAEIDDTLPAWFAEGKVPASWLGALVTAEATA